jgi:hypothetical protein
MAETNNSRIIQVNTPESGIIVDLAIQADISLRNLKNRMGFNIKASEGEKALDDFKDAIRSLHGAIQEMNKLTDTNAKKIKRLDQWLYPEEKEETMAS